MKSSEHSSLTNVKLNSWPLPQLSSVTSPAYGLAKLEKFVNSRRRRAASDPLVAEGERIEGEGAWELVWLLSAVAKSSILNQELRALLASSISEGLIDSMVPAMSPAAVHTRQRWLWLLGILPLAAGCIIAGLSMRRNRLVERDAELARQAMASGQLEEASTELERRSNGSPGSGEAHYLKARIAWARGELSTVHDELTRAISLRCPRHLWTGLQGLILVRANQ